MQLQLMKSRYHSLKKQRMLHIISLRENNKSIAITRRSLKQQLTIIERYGTYVFK